MLRPTQVRFENGWNLTAVFRVCWKRDGEKNEDRNCISGVGERQKRGGKREGSGRGGK